MKNKILFIAFVVIPFFSYANADTITSKMMSNVYWFTSASYKNQLNIQVGTINEKIDKRILFEYNPVSLSFVKQSGNYYVSSNAIPLVLALPSIYIVGKGVPEWALLPIFIPIVIAEICQVAGNWKFGVQVNKNIDLLVGQNTDFYPFYKMSRICTQSSIGIKMSYKSLRINIDDRFPWTKGYYENKKPYLNIGISYSPTYKEKIQ